MIGRNNASQVEPDSVFFCRTSVRSFAGVLSGLILVWTASPQSCIPVAGRKSCWRAPQQGGLWLSREIEPRSSGWRTVTPITTPPCWSSQQQYMVKCGTGTIQSHTEMFKWRDFFFFLEMFERNAQRRCLGHFSAVTDNVLSLDCQ